MKSRRVLDANPEKNIVPTLIQNRDTQKILQTYMRNAETLSNSSRIAIKAKGERDKID